MSLSRFTVLALCSHALAHNWLDDPISVKDVTLACTATSVDNKKIVVAAVGDSITVGATCNTWHGGFVKILQDTIGEDKYDVRDCGLCGHDAVRAGHGNLKHATYWDTPAFTNSQQMKPDVVIYMLGTNDADEWYNTSQYYIQDMKDLIGHYTNLTNQAGEPTKVVVMIPPPLSNYTCGASNPNPTCLKPFDKACTIDCVLPKLVPQIAADLNVHTVIDLLSFFGGPTDTNKTAMPGLHPDCTGYTMIGHYLAKELFGVGQ